MKRAAKIDDNQRALVSILRQAGYSVLSLAAIGKGVPDLLVARNGVMWLIEVKDGSKAPSRRRLTPFQKEFHATWRAPILVINSQAEILKFIANT